MEQESEIKCWICGAIANSREHTIKRSALKAVFGPPTQEDPLYYHNDETRNLPIGSLDNWHLTSPTKICSKCNNARTQPHDRAWETLSAELRSRRLISADGASIRANKVFPFNTRVKMLNVHLYFIKLFGCHICTGQIPIDISGFSTAIMQGKTHQEVYLKFGYSSGTHMGNSDIETQQTPNGECIFATWFYEEATIEVNVMYAKDGVDRQGLKNAWHPRLGTSKLHIEQF